MMRVYLDFETRSKVDLKKSGAWEYAKDTSTEILCLVYAVNDSMPQLITANELYGASPGFVEIYSMADLHALANNPEVIFEAHNAFFEQCIWKFQMADIIGYPEIPIERWRCSAAKAASFALPRSLEKCSKALKLDEQKDEEGKRIMLQLAKTRRASIKNQDEFFEENKYPEKFQDLYRYCITDVLTERAISKFLPDLNAVEQQIWFLDQRINQRGVAVDVEGVNAALKLINEYKEILNHRLFEITKGVVRNATQRDKILNWLNHNCALDLPDLRADTVAEYLASDKVVGLGREVLQIRQSVSKTSTAKYKAIQASCGKEGRVRDSFMYHAASTGRWGGKLVQMQNLPRGSIKAVDQCIEYMKLHHGNVRNFENEYEKPMEAISSCIRGMFIAGPGKELFVADFNAIEARVLWWLAQEKDGLKMFAEGDDPYVDMAVRIYNKEHEFIEKHERFLGKTTVLGCGYGMGPKKFHATALSYGLDIDQYTADEAVATYRGAYPKVCKFWYNMEDAAIKAVLHKKRVTCGYVSWQMTHLGFLLCHLPSGRYIAYHEPRVVEADAPWGWTKPQLEFTGINSMTHQIERQQTYGGKLVENATQAVARDFLAAAIMRLEKAGFPVVMHIHDEVVCEVPIAQKSMEEFINIMETKPLGVKALPIKAEGWRGKRYKK